MSHAHIVAALADKIPQCIGQGGQAPAAQGLRQTADEGIIPAAAAVGQAQSPADQIPGIGQQSLQGFPFDLAVFHLGPESGHIRAAPGMVGSSMALFAAQKRNAA